MVRPPPIVAFANGEDDDEAPKVHQSPENRAREQVLEVLRSLEGIERHLQVPRGATDKELLAGITSHQQPFVVLRNCGCSLAQAATTVDLLPLASSAPEPSGLGLPKNLYEGLNIRWELVATVAFLFLAVLLCCVAGGLQLSASSGWEVGRCVIASFTNLTCSSQAVDHQCMVSVEVQSDGQLHRMDAWQPAVEYAYGTSSTRNKFRHEAFRCCAVEDCCAFYKNGNYCDDWADSTDSRGRQCPSHGGTGWPCLFRLAANSEGTTIGQQKVVSELQAFQPPILWPLFTIAGLLVLVTICMNSRGHIQRIYERNILRHEAKVAEALNLEAEQIRSPKRSWLRRKAPAGREIPGSPLSRLRPGEVHSPAQGAKSSAQHHMKMAPLHAPPAEVALEDLEDAVQAIVTGKDRLSGTSKASKAASILPLVLPPEALPLGFVEQPEGEPPDIEKSGRDRFMPPPLASQFPPPAERRRPHSPPSPVARPEGNRSVVFGRSRTQPMERSMDRQSSTNSASGARRSQHASPRPMVRQNSSHSAAAAVSQQRSVVRQNSSHSAAGTRSQQRAFSRHNSGHSTSPARPMQRSMTWQSQGGSNWRNESPNSLAQAEPLGPTHLRGSPRPDGSSSLSPLVTSGRSVVRTRSRMGPTLSDSAVAGEDPGRGPPLHLPWCNGGRSTFSRQPSKVGSSNTASPQMSRMGSKAEFGGGGDDLS